MGKPKGLKDKLWGAAVLKMSFLIRGDLESVAFKSIYPGILRDLKLEDADVDRYIELHRSEVEASARGTPE